MAIFKCDSCGFSRKVGDDKIGKNAKCPECQIKGYVIKDNNISKKNIVKKIEPPKHDVKHNEGKSSFIEIFINLAVAAIVAAFSFLFYVYNQDIASLKKDVEYIQKDTDKLEGDLQNVQKNLGGLKNPSSAIISGDKGLNQLYLELKDYGSLIYY